MADDQEMNPAPDFFGPIREADRRMALDVFGKFLMEVRDSAISEFDAILAGRRRHGPWDRIVKKFPPMDEECHKLLADALPHIVDNFIYRLLADLDARQRDIRISVKLDGETVENLARVSWGLASEPTGDQGWLARFSRERFEQP